MVTLSGGPAWLIDVVNGDTDTGSCSSPAAIAGYPHITVPAGFFRGLPMSLSFFGRAWSEPVLLRLAYAFETATRARKKPAFAAAAEV
jgi:amidase